MQRKSETVNLRVTKEFKELLREAAKREHRTVAAFIEARVREYCSGKERISTTLADMAVRAGGNHERV